MSSVTHVVDSKNKEILNRYEYDAWGNPTLCEEKVPNRFLFNGQQYDQITRQYYLRVRYYNPVIARFTQEDTYRGDGLNLYAYCANNPVSYVDPSGHVQRAYGGVRTINLAHESHETVTAGEGRRAGDNRGGSKVDFYVTPEGLAIPQSMYHSLSDVDARKWYLAQEAKIPGLIDYNQSLEQQASISSVFIV